jgi:hypothetical protein
MPVSVSYAKYVINSNVLVGGVMSEATTPNYISLTEAANRCEYSQEYLSLRARQGKLKAVKQGRNWVTTHGWLLEYLKQVDVSRNEMKESTIVAATPTAPTTSSTPSAAKSQSIPVSVRSTNNAVSPAVVTSPAKSEAVTETPKLSFSEKVREELTFQPKVPTAWYEQEPETRQSRRFLDLDILGSGGSDADEAGAFWPVANQTTAQDAPAKKVSLKDAIAEETQKVTNFNFGMLRQAAVLAFSLLLLLEVGLIMRPMAANGTLQAAAENMKTKVALGVAVVTGQPLAFTWEQGSEEPIIASLVPQAQADSFVEETNSTTDAPTFSSYDMQDTDGQVAGATTERSGLSFSQKVAAGVLVVIDSPDDGQVSPFGVWLADTFDLPISQ